MNKTALTIVACVSFNMVHAFDWDLAIRTTLYSAIAPTLHVLMKAPKNQNTLRGISAACCAISSVTSTYYAVLLERSDRTSDKFLSFAAGCLGGLLGGAAHGLAEWTYTEYQNEKAWERYQEEREAAMIDLEEQEDTLQNEDQIRVTFGADPQI